MKKLINDQEEKGGGTIKLQVYLAGGTASLTAKAAGGGLEASGFSTMKTFSADGWYELEMPRECVYKAALTGSAEIWIVS